MLGFFEILVIGAAIFLLVKRYTFQQWVMAIKSSTREFKKALHEKPAREVKEYRFRGDSDAR